MFEGFQKLFIAIRSNWVLGSMYHVWYMIDDIFLKINKTLYFHLSIFTIQMILVFTCYIFVYNLNVRTDSFETLSDQNLFETVFLPLCLLSKFFFIYVKIYIY